MAETSTAHAAYARESRVNEGRNNIQVRRFQISDILITDLLRTMLAGSAFLAPKRGTRDVPFPQF
jgi:hypothetical protein